MKRLLVCLLPGVLAAPLLAQRPAAQRRPLDVRTFLTLDRVGEPAISPDGRWVAYTVTVTSIEQNRRRSDLWLQAADGTGEPRRVSTDSLGGRSAVWSPDGRQLAYVSSRGGAPQVRIYDVTAQRHRQVTAMPNGADGVIWSPGGRWLAFVSDVYFDCGADEACNLRRAAEAEARPSRARVIDELLYRHWNAWEDGLRSHLFVVPASGGAPRDLLLGRDFDTPVPPFGGSTDYAFSPDERQVAFTAKTGRTQAWHTNSDVYVIPVSGGEPVNVTNALEGADNTPAYSPDGRYLAFLSQRRARFEADRWRLMVLERSSGRIREVTSGWDYPIRGFQWLAGSREFLATAEKRQRDIVVHVALQSGEVREVLADRDVTTLSAASVNGTTVAAFVSDAVHRPPDVFVWNVDGRSTPRQLTRLNADRLADLALAPAREFGWIGADGDSVFGFLVMPPSFDPNRRYPALVLIHGGPQNAWLDGFGTRWNAAMFGSPGYVVALLNPRGSTGFGQRFTDQISRDWGGRVYEDIMRGVDVVARLPFVDSTRMGAAGGSYGGYMVNWINGHTDRFRALITHAGVFNLESMYGATEELWFPEWDLGGPYWADRADYERWSPHRFAANFRTPTLVIHGALDFRVPETEGMQAFTALQRQGVASRFLYFPDEGHWVLRPANQVVWWNTMHDWLGRYLRP